jgi:hypothetical protein
MKFPVSLFHPDSKDPKKRIYARNEEQLAGLMRIGWKVISEPVTIQGNHPIEIQGN